MYIVLPMLCLEMQHVVCYLGERPWKYCLLLVGEDNVNRWLVEYQ